MEKINFETETDFFDALDSAKFFEYRNEKLSGFDSEKGFVDVTVYLKRVSDGKKFTAQYTKGGQGEKWANELCFEEVVERRKKSNKKVTGEEMAGLLSAIHHHHPDNEKIIYYEDDLLKVLEAIGLPAPEWKISLTVEEYKKLKS